MTSMTNGATVQPVARLKGELSDEDRQALIERYGEFLYQQREIRKFVVGMVERSSFRAVADMTGLSTNTLQRWKREAK